MTGRCFQEKENIHWSSKRWRRNLADIYIRTIGIMMVVATVNANLMNSQRQSKAGLMKIVDDNIKKVWELKVVDSCCFDDEGCNTQRRYLLCPFHFNFNTVKHCVYVWIQDWRAGGQDSGMTFIIWHLQHPIWMWMSVMSCSFSAIFL